MRIVSVKVLHACVWALALSAHTHTNTENTRVFPWGKLAKAYMLKHKGKRAKDGV